MRRTFAIVLVVMVAWAQGQCSSGNPINCGIQPNFGQLCCPSGTNCCGSSCCPSGQECCGGSPQVCCNPGFRCLGGFCSQVTPPTPPPSCPSGILCSNSTGGQICCPTGSTGCCGDICCNNTAPNCCGRACCAPGINCCGGVCCPSGICCGNQCCTAGQTCGGPNGTCITPPPVPPPFCQGGNICTNTTGQQICCPSGSNCCGDLCCNSTTPNCCGRACCAPGINCCGGVCCPSGICCGNQCCTAGQTCGGPNGTCITPPPVPPPFCQGGLLCSNSTGQQICCPSGSTGCCGNACCNATVPICCGNLCCPNGNTCCGGACCASRVCCGTVCCPSANNNCGPNNTCV